MTISFFISFSFLALMEKGIDYTFFLKDQESHVLFSKQEFLSPNIKLTIFVEKNNNAIKMCP